MPAKHSKTIIFHDRCDVCSLFLPANALVAGTVGPIIRRSPGRDRTPTRCDELPFGYQCVRRIVHILTPPPTHHVVTWSNRHMFCTHELNDGSPLPVTAPRSGTMCDTTEKQNVACLERWFVDLWQINTGRRWSRDRIRCLVTARDADEAPAIVAEAGGLVVQCPQHIQVVDM